MSDGGRGRATGRTTGVRPVLLAPLAGMLLAACGGGGSTSATVSQPTSPAPTISAASTSATEAPSPTATASPAPTPATPAADPLQRCPAARPLDQVDPLARISGDADDLAVTPQGRIWLSLLADRRILELDASGRVIRSLADPQGPEGIVVLADGRLAVAEQLANRVVILDPSTGSRTTLATLPPGSGDGVDGIGLDAGGRALLVPDSPAGLVMRIPLDGSAPTTLARGLGRPVTAAALGDGSILVGVENAPGVVRIGADGSTRAVAAAGTFHSVDEVIVRSGAAYVADLVDHRVAALDPASGRVAVLVTGSPSPQGLALAGGTGLLLADSTRRQLFSLDGCS